MPRFDVLEIRRVRKTLQWLVVPMGVLAVLTLSHPILPLLLCFLALGALVTATYVGFVEEQVDVSGSPWLWMKARTLPCEECTFTKVEKSPTYREPYDAPQPTRVVRRHVHWFTRWVAMMPMAMGGGRVGVEVGVEVGEANQNRIQDGKKPTQARSAGVCPVDARWLQRK